MDDTKHSKAVKQNLLHMGTNSSEWTALPIEKFSITKDSKQNDIVMPEFKFPANYGEAPTLYKGECCGWCGHTVKKELFWIVNHSKQWVLPVGCECIKSFLELTEEQEQEIKAITTVKPEEVKQINAKISEGQTVKQAVTITRKYNSIEKRFLKKYPEPNQELENWWENTINKWNYAHDHYWYPESKSFLYWGIKSFSLEWPTNYHNSIDYLRLPKEGQQARTAYELWEGYKTRYIENKSKSV